MSMQLRGRLDSGSALLAKAIGLGAFLLFWLLIARAVAKPGIMPSPVKVLVAIPNLLMSKVFWGNLGYSLVLTVVSAVEAALIALPLGFAIGLVPGMRAVFEKPIAATRYLPLTATIGLFLIWAGISTNMKIQFLTVCSLVYFLPAVVNGIDRVSQVHLDTIKTLGANNWQTITKVYLPATLSAFTTDAIVLMPIGWTYIIIAEIINLGDGGVGAMIFTASRRSRLDEVFALLLIIIAIGFIEDKVLKFLDGKIFPHKYQEVRS